MIAICGNIDCRHRRTLDLRQIAEYVGERHPLVPVRGHLHFSERLKCLACKHVGAFIWLGPPKEPEPLYGNAFAYKINNWGAQRTGTLVTTVAQVKHVVVAHATFEAALAAYPGDQLTLQEGMFVLRDGRFSVIDGGKKAG
jgi:hypothetical protein